MLQTLRELTFPTLCLLYAFGIGLMTVQYVHLYPSRAEAQSSGGYVAVAIGGTTEGVSDVCCNGVVLEFDSIAPLNPFILDGEAIMVPLLSSSYDNGNEYSEGYNVLGTVHPGICITVESECYSEEFKPEIGVIGTSKSSSSGGM